MIFYAQALSEVFCFKRKKRARNIQLLALDVDGVLTNGTFLSLQGEELKFFNAQDGLGLKTIQKRGLQVAAISGRYSQSVQLRLSALGIQYIYQNQKHKLPLLMQIAKELALSFPQIAYVGDDLPDIPILERVGLAIAVKNAVPEVKKIAHWETRHKGGEGAVREVCDFLLRCRQ